MSDEMESRDMDPLTGALIGAAGAAGKEVGSVSNDPKIRHALLLPVANVVGKELAQRAERLFERGNAKRLENLGAHVDRAIDVSSVEKIEKISDDPSFIDWAAQVSKVNPGDTALSEVWQAALLALQSGGTRRLRILSIAKQMQPDEAALFLKLGRDAVRRRNSAPWPLRAIHPLRGTASLPLKIGNRYRERFVDLGLVDTVVERLIGTPSGLAAVLFACVAAISASGVLALAALLFDQSPPPLRFVAGFAATLYNVLPRLASIFALVAAVFLTGIAISYPRLKSDGRDLLKFVDKLLLTEEASNSSDNEGKKRRTSEGNSTLT
jgi:hypothetical protein